MHLIRRVALPLFVLLAAASGFAQTPLGQPSLDEQKVQVWCATVKFVYDDTGRPNLKNGLRCGGSLKELAGSIKADSQRVYSALYEPLEGRGTMYKGLGSDKSRLQKLATEIINRLKASPARRGNSARMQGVATLEAALNNYVQNGTPIGELATTETPETTDTAAAEASLDANEPAAAAPGDAGPAEAGVASPITPARGAGESLMNKFFGPLALILALLSLALYLLMRRNIGAFQKELSARIDRRREEIVALQNTPANARPAPIAAPDHLTAAQQQEVEKLVEQRLAQELRKLRQELAATQSAAAAPAAPTTPAEPEMRPVPPAQPEYVAPTTPPVAAYAEPDPVPTPPAPIEAPVTAVPASPPAALHDEFDSLVPPVQLPAPEPYVAPAALSLTRYVKVPVNGAFSEYDLTEEPQHDSIYEITLDAQRPEAATFRVTTNPQVHAYAIQSAQYSLREACTYQQPAGAVTRIVNEKEGLLRRVGGAWQIEQKAAIRFE